MNVSEVLLRSLLASAAIGLPAYGIGMWRYQGRRVSGALLTSIAILSGFAAGLVVLADRAPWMATVAIAALFAVMTVGVMALMIKAQDLIFPKKGKR